MTDPSVESTQMNCASSERVTHFLEKNVFFWNDLMSTTKSSKECTPTLFDKFLVFMRTFSIGQTFTSN